MIAALRTDPASVSVDSNILIYAFDSSNHAKHGIAIRILDTLQKTSPLAMQCLGEFYSVVTRRGLIEPGQASLIVDGFMGMIQVIAAQPEQLTHAMDIQQRYRIQFFDALIFATLLQTDCRILLSEDLQHEGLYGTIRVVNPFKLSQYELDALLA